MSSLKSTVSAVMQNFMKVTTGHILDVYLGYKCFPAVPFHSHGKVEPRPGVVMVLQTRQNQIQVLPVHTTLFSLETRDFIQWNNIQITYPIRNVWQISGMFIRMLSVCLCIVFNREQQKGLLNHHVVFYLYITLCENSPYSWHRGELVESWCRWRSCSLQLVPSSYRCHQRGAARSQLQNVFF